MNLQTPCVAGRRLPNAGYSIWVSAVHRGITNYGCCANPGPGGAARSRKYFGGSQGGISKGPDRWGHNFRRARDRWQDGPGITAQRALLAGPRRAVAGVGYGAADRIL